MVCGVSAPTASQAPPPPEPLAPLVDAHTHLDACGARDADGRPRHPRPRRRPSGFCAAVTIADDLDAARWAAEAADLGPAGLRRGGAAPDPGRRTRPTSARAELERLAAQPRVVAIGETGMDLYWPGKLDGCAEPGRASGESFAWHIDLAKRTGKPLMIHNRDADADVLDVLRAEGAPETVIFHCFSSGPEMARTCVDAGWVLSLSGTVSFKNARDLREAAALDPARPAAGGDRRAVSDPASRTAGHRTSRTACRTPCGRWPRSSAGRAEVLGRAVVADRAGVSTVV